jgi:hypothetical protein
MRLERVRQLVDKAREATTIDEVEHRIRRSNELMSKWRNPYTLELVHEEAGLFLLASPEYRTMHNLGPWQRVLFLNFSKFEYPTMKERIGEPDMTGQHTGPHPEVRGR